MFDIVIPLYNKAAFIEATVDSVLRQGLRHWRLFVVDDGSTDGGPALVEHYDDPRIRLIRQANQGVGPARNAGIGAGAADWIAFLDADDVWHDDHLAELDALRRSFPGADMIGCAFERFGEGSAPPRRPGAFPERWLVRYFAECARGRELFVTSSAAVRRAALAEVGLFEPLPGNEDVELWARLALHGPVAVSRKVTVRYRVDTGGITDQGAAERGRPDGPVRREDMSSTIPTLTERLPGITDQRLRGEIIDYMDSRIGLSVVAAVRRGEIGYARKLLSLYEGRPRGRAWLASIIARLPHPLGGLVAFAGVRLLGALQGLRRVRPRAGRSSAA